MVFENVIDLETINMTVQEHYDNNIMDEIIIEDPEEELII